MYKEDQTPLEISLATLLLIATPGLCAVSRPVNFLVGKTAIGNQNLAMAFQSSRGKLKTAYVTVRLVYKFLTCLTDVPQVSFKKGRVIAPLYTGGPVSASHDGRMLVTCVGEEAILTDIEQGIQIARFTGVRFFELSHLISLTDLQCHDTFRTANPSLRYVYHPPTSLSSFSPLPCPSAYTTSPKRPPIPRKPSTQNVWSLAHTTHQFTSAPLTQPPPTSPQDLQTESSKSGMFPADSRPMSFGATVASSLL